VSFFHGLSFCAYNKEREEEEQKEEEVEYVVKLHFEPKRANEI
jgi:hypothetical protein